MNLYLNTAEKIIKTYKSIKINILIKGTDLSLRVQGEEPAQVCDSGLLAEVSVYTRL